MSEVEKVEKDIVKIKTYLGKSSKFMNRQWKMSYIMFFILAAFLYFTGITILIGKTNEKLTTNNTYEYTATISKIQSLPQYSIQVDEYNAVLGINQSDAVINLAALGELSVGQTITFRVTKESSKQLDKIIERVELVSLKVGATDIITLKSYNDYVNSPGTFIFPTILGTVMLGFGIWFRKMYKGRIRDLEELLSDNPPQNNMGNNMGNVF